MDDLEGAVAEINELLAGHRWCDFEVIGMSHDLVLGGHTGFPQGDAPHDLTITFGEVFYAQVLASWRTDTTAPALVLPDVDEQRRVNLAYDVERGNRLVRIQAEDVDGPMYVSARTLRYTTRT